MNKADVILVLSGGFDHPEQDMRRLQLAIKLFFKLNANKIIISGKGAYKNNSEQDTTEARYLANMAVVLGFDENKLLLEQESMESIGNLYFTKTKFLIPHKWIKVAVVPSFNHSDERINYMLKKVFGKEIIYKVYRNKKNQDLQNLDRERRSLELIKKLSKNFKVGDHEAIWTELVKNHPAYNKNAKYTLEELKKLLG